jgi:predicted transcriptional regulator
LPVVGGGGVKEAFDVEGFWRLAYQAQRRVMDQREEILGAFVAKYGFEPERAVQIEQRMRDGTTRWFVRRLSDEEMVEASRMGSKL